MKMERREVLIEGGVGLVCGVLGYIVGVRFESYRHGSTGRIVRRIHRDYGVRVETFKDNLLQVDSLPPKLMEEVQRAFVKVPYAAILAPRVVLEFVPHNLFHGSFDERENPPVVEIMLPLTFDPGIKRDIPQGAEGMDADDISRGEQLQRLLVHEYAHALTYTVRTNMQEGDPVIQAKLLYIPFAKLIGWEWGRLPLYRFFPSIDSPDARLEHSGYSEGWVNPWAEVELFSEGPKKYSLKKNYFRVSHYATMPGPGYFTAPEDKGFKIIPNDIGETFAEFFTAYHFHRNLLTADEVRFFERVQSGLLRDGEGFIKKVANDPNVLLLGV